MRGRDSLRLLGLVVFLFLALSSVAVAEALEKEWIGIETQQLVVHFWKEARGFEFEQVEVEPLDHMDLYLLILAGIADGFEARFQRVESLLGISYDPQEEGKVYLFVYPSLAAYQEAVGCLICAANVGGFLSSFMDDELMAKIRAGEVNPIAVYLNRGSFEFEVLHEFTHVLDFSLIDNYAPVVMYEGLASYVGYKLDEVDDRLQFGLINQYLKLYSQEYEVDLLEYFNKGRYFKFTYNIGTSFIDFLVGKGGWEEFSAFYAELDFRPFERSDKMISTKCLDQLSQEHYGASFTELEREWKKEFAGVEISADGRAAYEFKLDQILIRYIFLRPLIKEVRRLRVAFDNVRAWTDGRFNHEEARFMRRYLSNLENFIATKEGIDEVMTYMGQLWSYIYMYYDDPQVLSEFGERLNELTWYYVNERYEEFKEFYVGLIHQYITWRGAPQDDSSK